MEVRLVLVMYKCWFAHFGHWVVVVASDLFFMRRRGDSKFQTIFDFILPK